MSDKVILYKYVFNRRNRLNKKKEAQIELQINKDGFQEYLYTGISVPAECWNSGNNRVIKHKESDFLNSSLIHFDTNAKKKERYLKDKNGSCSVHELKTELNKKETSIYFTDYCFSQLAKENRNEEYIIKATRFLNRFKEFSNNATIKALNNRLFDDYIKALLKENLNPNYINKLLSPLRKYVKECIKYELIERNKDPFEGVILKAQKTDKTYLTIEEINELEAIKFDDNKKNHELIRDFFLFQIYSGMRFGDVCALNKNSITKTKQGYLIDNLKAEKTNKKFQTPLFALFPEMGKASKPEQILNKYLNSKETHFFNLPNGKTDKASNQYVNKILRQFIIPRTSIKKHITTHVARHTFATFLINKIPVPVVAILLQHSKIATTMIYTHLEPSNVIIELQKNKTWE
jgi:site-specific recombinase XerD